MSRIKVALLTIILVLCANHVIAQCEADGATQIDQGSVPYTITTSGKYQVVDNLSVAAGTLIDIQNTAVDVYLCLSGFQLSSPDVIIDADNTGSLVVRDGTLVNALVGVYATNMESLTVENLQISGFTNTAIYSFFNSHIALRNNTMQSSGSSMGIHVNGPVEGTIEGNTIIGAGVGMDVYDGSSVQIIRNRIAHLDTFAYAIGVGSSESCLIAENEILDIPGSGSNGHGIWLYETNGSKIYNNVVRGAGIHGIFIDDFSDDNLVLHNTISNSGIHGLVIRGSYNQIQENVSNSNTCYGITFENAVGNPRYNVHRGNTARGNFGLSCGAPTDPCAFICSEDFCLGEPLTNTSQGDSFMPCLGPAGCNACER